MRRIALLTAPLLIIIAAAGCRHDGRTLREPRPDQTATISTLAPATDDVPGFDTVGSEPVTLPPSDAPLNVTAPWRNGAPVDPRYTCSGLNISPPLSWSAAPEGTAEIALSLVDLDAPDFVHWVVGGIQPQIIAVAEGEVPLGAYEAANSLGNGAIGYTGPCPPAGQTHTYVVTVHYLASPLQLDDGTPGAAMLEGIEAGVLASAELTGTFSRG